MNLVRPPNRARLDMAPDQAEDPLRPLYLDWCSARVARRFLELSLDEVWLRSDFAASLPAAPREPHTPEASSLLALDRIPGYLDLVRRTALVLAQEMELPSFSEWREAYLEDPEPFRREMLGR
jgi:hypothetical protein